MLRGVRFALVGALPKKGCRIGRDADMEVDMDERECVFMGMGLLFQRPLSDDTAKHV